MTREEIAKVCHIVHSTIVGFLDSGEDFTQKDYLLLKVNRAICAEIEKLDKEGDII